jgi:hypothetical protein
MRDQRSDTADQGPCQVSGAQSGCAVRSGGDLTGAALTWFLECHLLESALVSKLQSGMHRRDQLVSCLPCIVLAALLGYLGPLGYHDGKAVAALT